MILLAALVVALAIGAAAAAYLDWYMWHPMSAIVTTMGLGLVLIVGGLAVLVRSARIRPIGLVLLALAAGGFAGQALGPVRPTTHHTDTGSMHVVLTGSTSLDASGAATCGLVEGGGQILVDPDEFGLARVSEAADFHYVNVAIGDMWDFGDPLARPDHVSVTIRTIRALVTEDGKPGETIDATDRASTVTLGPTTSAGGSITFSNLVVADEQMKPGARSEVTGTITWTCGPIVPGLEV
jgi:hypothetical protein